MAMNIQERADQAAKLKATGVCNCTQSVLKVFEDKIPMEEQDIMKLMWCVNRCCHGIWNVDRWSGNYALCKRTCESLSGKEWRNNL